MSKLVGQKRFHLIEDSGCATLMYGEWFVLRIRDGKIERYSAIGEDVTELNLDKNGCVRVSKETM